MNVKHSLNLSLDSQISSFNTWINISEDKIEDELISSYDVSSIPCDFYDLSVTTLKETYMWPHAVKIIDEDNPEFFTSLSVSVPLENRDAKAKLKQAEFEKAKALLDAKYLERKIAIEIVDQARECEIFYERLVSLKKAADLQTQKAAAQEKIFNQGRSDSDVVIRYQEDALAARVRAVNAFYEYYEALIDLKKKEGSLLVEHWDGEI